MPVEYLEEPVKSENDTKEYRVIRLQNGLTAMLIADLHSETCVSQDDDQAKAGCGLCVGVGGFSDPPEIPGMAHFLEHMIFMGSEKYRKENNFDAFIIKRGGYTNATTDCEHTTFYFDVQEKHLLPALDRFAQFFIKPLMKKDAVTRERETVENEFQMFALNDINRKEQLFSSFARAGHPANKFIKGNLITLRNNVDDD